MRYRDLILSLIVGSKVRYPVKTTHTEPRGSKSRKAQNRANHNLAWDPRRYPPFIANPRPIKIVTNKKYIYKN